jgi:hypothetical protein
MQYTASSFVQPATAFFAAFLQTRNRCTSAAGPFPQHAAFSTETPDLWMERIYQRGFTALGRAAGRLRWLQHGRIHIYILYLALTLIVLLVWYLGLARVS